MQQNDRTLAGAVQGGPALEQQGGPGLSTCGRAHVQCVELIQCVRPNWTRELWTRELCPTKTRVRLHRLVRQNSGYNTGPRSTRQLGRLGKPLGYIAPATERVEHQKSGYVGSTRQLTSARYIGSFPLQGDGHDLTSELSTSEVHSTTR